MKIGKKKQRQAGVLISIRRISNVDYHHRKNAEGEGRRDKKKK
jgi:hypothetical protein